MNLKKFFIADNYLTGLKLLKKRIKIRRLEKLNFTYIPLNPTWEIRNDTHLKFPFSEKNDYSIFGVKINLEEEINWHLDEFSGFVYPLKRFDKINAVQHFDKGIEIVFPWEQSRFYFAINLARKYLAAGDTTYYKIFKKLVLDWIKKNPFLYGTSWGSTMDVAIRAVNWIVALNLFWKIFEKDEKFKTEISKSLVMHAEYVFAFPLIEKNNLTTNHTTSAYAGFLFLSLALSEHDKAQIWLKTAIKGLEKCIEDQVYDDGVDFEGSIPYHRLVLELFAYSAILTLSNNINFSSNFYKKLFKMFEFTAAYMDKNGNAPQVGDNDSGRLLIFNDENNDPYLNEHDHSYLLSIGEYIFNYKFKSSCRKSNNSIINYFPAIKKTNIDELGIIPRETDRSISFENGGAYIMKNDKFNILVSCFPPGQRGKAGHNHLDAGSFTLSINDEQVIVDAGSYGYSRNRKERDKFRSYIYHNTLNNNQDKGINLKKDGYWSLNKYYETELIDFKNYEIKIKIKNIYDGKERFRKFEMKNDALIITDECEGDFSCRLNFHPESEIFMTKENEVLGNKFRIETGSRNFELLDYEYSDFYGQQTKAKALIFNSNNILETKIIFSS